MQKRDLFMLAAIIICALQCLVCPVMAADTETKADYPPGYWDAAIGIPQNAAAYSIAIETGDVVAVQVKISQLMAASGAQSSNNYFGGFMYGLNQNAAFTLHYQVPVAQADSAGKMILDMGNPKQYHVQKFVSPAIMAMLDKKIGELSGEINGHKKELLKMPVASNILGGILKRLQQNKEDYIKKSANADMQIAVYKTGTGDEKTAGAN